MREQMYLPTGEGSSKSQEEGSAPKVLGRPSLPMGLERPRPLARKNVIVGFRCGCGATRPKYAGCQTIPIYEEDGWTGGDRYDGKSIPGHELDARRETYRKENNL